MSKELIDTLKHVFGAENVLTEEDIMTPCELCNGTGYVNGARCACMEEDDAAGAARAKMGVVSNPNRPR